MAGKRDKTENKIIAIWEYYPYEGNSAPSFYEKVDGTIFSDKEIEEVRQHIEDKFAKDRYAFLGSIDDKIKWIKKCDISCIEAYRKSDGNEVRIL